MGHNTGLAVQGRELPALPSSGLSAEDTTGRKKGGSGDSVRSLSSSTSYHEEVAKQPRLQGQFSKFSDNDQLAVYDA